MNNKRARDDDVRLLLACFGKVVARKKPFAMLWDARRFFPILSSTQLNMFQAFFDDHYLTWDKLLQQHITVIGNPFARAFAHLVTRVFALPQPVYHGRNVEDANEHALRCCRKIRSYVKTADEYGSAPGWGAFKW